MFLAPKSLAREGENMIEYSIMFAEEVVPTCLVPIEISLERLEQVFSVFVPVVCLKTVSEPGTIIEKVHLA